MHFGVEAHRRHSCITILVTIDPVMREMWISAIHELNPKDRGNRETAGIDPIYYALCTVPLGIPLRLN